jgi:hypothetical protein
MIMSIVDTFLHVIVLLNDDFDISLLNEIINEDDDGPRNGDHVLNHSGATNQGDQQSLVRSPRNSMYDYSENDIPPSDDVQIVERLQRNIMSMTRSIPFYINPKHSSYTRSKKEFLTKSFSIGDLISSDCWHNNCLKSIEYMYAL